MFRHLGMHHCSLSFASLILTTITVCTSSYVRQSLFAAGLARYQTAPANPVAMSDESVAGGLKVYLRFCHSCHGTGCVGDGPGAPPDVMPPSLIDAECFEGCADGEIFNAIRNGVPPDYYMEPWEGRITDEDIWDLVNYLSSLTE